MLRSFHIENFKSLSNFTMDGLGQFICLIGLNGAGKTTVLQAIDFMAHLATGEVDLWLKERDWQRSDLTSKLNKSNRRLINFRLEFDFGHHVVWEGSYNISLGRCTTEEMHVDGFQECIFEFSDRQLTLFTTEGNLETIDFSRFELKDSILSFLKPSVRDESITVRPWRFMNSLKSLELLAPHRMRMKSRASNDVGIGGEKLSGYLHKLKAPERESLLSELQTFYPHLAHIGTKSQRAGWAQTSTVERYQTEDNKRSTYVEVDAQHINDGLLRILTIVAQTKSSRSFLLFDEIENGINPEKIGQLVEYLLKAKQQILVTTHNPLILNFLPDDRARESVVFLYRNRFGATKAVRFFEIPEVAKKLKMLGPGEAFLDTSLEELPNSIEEREGAPR